MEQIKTFKLMLIGKAKSGKTSWIQRLNNQKFTSVYSPTIGVDVSSFVVKTNHGTFRLNIWDCAGNEALGGGRTGYYLGSNGCIIFHDLSTSNDVEKLKQNYHKINPDTPVLIVGSKRDEILNEDQSKLNQADIMISVKIPFEVLSPIKRILEEITGVSGLEVVKVMKKPYTK